MVYTALHLTPKPGLFPDLFPLALCHSHLSPGFSQNMLFTHHIVSTCCSFCWRSSHRDVHMTHSSGGPQLLRIWRKCHLLRPHLDTYSACTHTLLITLFPALFFSLFCHSLPSFSVFIDGESRCLCPVFTVLSGELRWCLATSWCKCLLNKWTCNLLLYGWGLGLPADSWRLPAAPPSHCLSHDQGTAWVFV